MRRILYLVMIMLALGILAVLGGLVHAPAPGQGAARFSLPWLGTRVAKSTKRKRQLRHGELVADVDVAMVRRLMPYV